MGEERHGKHSFHGGYHPNNRSFDPDDFVNPSGQFKQHKYNRLKSMEETYGSCLSVLPYILFKKNLLPQLNMDKMLDPPCIIRHSVMTVYMQQVYLDALLLGAVQSCLVNA
eukprot:15365561-Ditylum_brightwellii.AAC.1